MNDQIAKGPTAIFNFADIKESDIEAIRTVVITRDGKPKPLAGVSVEMETTYQVWDASAGDIVLNCSLSWETVEDSGEQEIVPSLINVMGENLDENATEEDLLDEETASSIVDFLTNQDLTIRHFTLSGFTDSIDGESLNAMYQRRKKLADLFEDVTPTVKDRMVNWIDSPENQHMIDIDSLSWDNALALPDKLYVSRSVTRNDDVERTNGSSAIVWRRQDDGSAVATYHDVASIDKIMNENTVSLSYAEIVELGDDVIRVVKFDVDNDNLSSLNLLHFNGIPGEIVPEHLLVEPDNLTEFMSRANLTEDDWDELDLDEKTIYSNTLGYGVYDLDMDPEDVIEHLGERYYEEDFDLINEALIYSGDDGATIIVLPAAQKELDAPILIAYQRPVDTVDDEDNGDYEEDNDANSSS